MYIEEIEHGRGSGQRRILLILEILAARRFGISMRELMQVHFSGFCTKTVKRDLALLDEFGLIQRRKVLLPHSGRPGVMYFAAKKTLDLFCIKGEHANREDIQSMA